MNNDLDILTTEATLTTPETASPLLEVEEARVILKAILRQHSQLMTEGFVTERNNYLYANSRKVMLSDSNVLAFIACRNWLQQFNKLETFNKDATSYGFKHKAERDSESYFPNGIFIAAAVKEGFQLQRIKNTPNVLLNIEYGPTHRNHNRWRSHQI
jgi:hypothetical protein